jgi:ribonucleoside-triphosphate reductase (thioredoxin)
LSRYLPTDYQKYIHTSRYARWNDNEGRRETWEETVDRYFHFFKNRLPIEYLELYHEIDDVYESVLKLDVVPSMRCLMTAGKALEKDNVAGYNCAYVAVDDPHVFDEVMYILMCGTGVGFSVEKHATEQLPKIAPKFYKTNTTVVVEDSKLGWASAFRELLALLYTGKIPKWDTSKVRPAGSRLLTFGGRASGPEPLISLFQFAIEIFKNAAGRKLSTIECHDLMCKIADIVVVGGVRRSALISLSDLEDIRMRDAKSGEWWNHTGHRRLANNSAVYDSTPPIGVFMEEWASLYKSHSGERGIFNREASIKQASKNGRRIVEYQSPEGMTQIRFGTNPCSEIILRNKQFCNLSEIVVRPNDTLETLTKKVRHATILGTLQSTLTDFRYLSDRWTMNTKEERLLGVSMTGIMDHPFLANVSPKAICLEGTEAKLPEVLQTLRQVSIDTNKEWSVKLGIEQSTAITCVKPSGTVSQLVDAASGIHPRFSQYYIRTVRADKKDPVSKLMRDSGIPVEDDITSPQQTDVFAFPMKSPSTTTLRDNVSALDQLRLCLIYQKYWCEHKPSITVYVREDEWMEVGAFVYKYFDQMSGVSFLPFDNGTYRQAPYTEVTEQEYENAVDMMPPAVDWGALSLYEKEDQTTSGKELACVAGSCEI